MSLLPLSTTITKDKIDDDDHKDCKSIHIRPVHAVGFQGSQVIQYLTDQIIVKVVGTQLCMQNLSSNAQFIVPYPPPDHQDHHGPQWESCGDIQALRVCPRRRFLAIGRVGRLMTQAGTTSTSVLNVMIYRIDFPITREEEENSSSPEKEGQIDLTYRVLLSFPHLSSSERGHVHEIQTLSFSHDSALLGVQLGATSDFRLTIWEWKRQKILATLDLGTQVKTLSFHPSDKTLLATSGSHHLGLWKIQHQSITPYPRSTTNLRQPPKNKSKQKAGCGGHHHQQQPQGYEAHAWLVGKDQIDQLVAVNTQTSEIQIFQNGQVLYTIERDELPVMYRGRQSTDVGCLFSAVAVSSEGIVVGTKDGQALLFFEYTGSPSWEPVAASTETKFASISSAGKSQKCRRSLQYATLIQIIPPSSSSSWICPPSSFLDLVYDPSETNVLFKTRYSYQYLSVNHLGMMTNVGGLSSSSLTNVGGIAMTIVDVAICTRKPYLLIAYQELMSSISAPSSHHHHIMLWNYETQEPVIQQHFSSGPVSSLDIHPSGYQVLITSGSKVRMYHVVHNRLQCFMEMNVPKTNLCRFNHGGSQFAILSSETIRIYSVFGTLTPFSSSSGSSPPSSFPLIGMCRATSEILAFVWAGDDLAFVSVDMKRIVQHWNLRDVSSNHTDDDSIALTSSSSRTSSWTIPSSAPSTSSFCPQLTVISTLNLRSLYTIVVGVGKIVYILPVVSDDITGVRSLEFKADISCLSTCPTTKNWIRPDDANVNEGAYADSMDTTLVIGTRDGKIQLYRDWTSATIPPHPVVNEELHQSSVDRLVFSLDGAQVLSCSLAEGSIFLSSVVIEARVCPQHSPQRSGHRHSTIQCQVKERDAAEEDDLILVSKSHWLDLEFNLSAETTRVRECQRTHEVALEDLTRDHALELEDMRGFVTRAIESARQAAKDSSEELRVLREGHLTESKRQDERLTSALAAADVARDTSDLKAQRRHECLERQNRELRHALEDARFQSEEREVEVKGCLHEEVEGARVQMRERAAEVEGVLHEKILELERVLRDQDQDQLRHLMSLEGTCETKLRTQDQVHSSRRIELARVQHTAAVLSRTLEDQNVELENLVADQSCAQVSLETAQERVLCLERDRDQLREELEAHQTLATDLRQQLKTTERKHLVTLHELESLTGTVEPQARELELVRERLEQLMLENERQVSVANDLDQALQDREQRLKMSQHRLDRAQDQVKQDQRELLEIRYDIEDRVSQLTTGDGMSTILNGNHWKKAFIDLRDKVVQRMDSSKEQRRHSRPSVTTQRRSLVSDKSKHAEHETLRQRRIMMKSIQSLQSRVMAQELEKKEWIRKSVDQNSSLLGEINQLRKDNHRLMTLKRTPTPDPTRVSLVEDESENEARAREEPHEIGLDSKMPQDDQEPRVRSILKLKKKSKGVRPKVRPSSGFSSRTTSSLLQQQQQSTLLTSVGKVRPSSTQATRYYYPISSQKKVQAQERPKSAGALVATSRPKRILPK